MLGYFVGNVPFVKSHVELMILLIAHVSLLPCIAAVGLNLLSRPRRPVDPSPSQTDNQGSAVDGRIHVAIDRRLPSATAKPVSSQLFELQTPIQRVPRLPPSWPTT